MTERFALAAKDHKHQQAITSTQMQNTKTSFVSMGVGMAVAENVSYLFPLTLLKQRHRRRTNSRIPPIPSFIFVTTKRNNMASNAGGRRAGANNYSKLEIQSLLDLLMEGILPIGPDDWNEVLMRHSILFPYH